jgi:hypothetical protein
MRARFAATLPLILAACGDNTAPAGARSGGRLALYAYTFSDGTRLPNPGVYHDLLRNEDCVLDQWSDGETYCTPFVTDQVFADTTCTDAVARITASQVVPINYARVPFITGTGTTLISRLHPLGAPRTVSQYWKVADGGCVGPFDSSDGATFRDSATTELASDAFVHVVTLADAGGDRLEPLRQLSDDGFSVPIGFHDRELAFDCSVYPAADSDTSRCTPTSAVAGSYFSDATCTTPTIAAANASFATAIMSNSACSTYYAVGTTLATTLYDGTPGHCVATTPGGDYLTAGAPLVLADVARKRRATDTRYSPITFDATDVRDGYVHDNQLDVDCSPRSGRCLPAEDDAFVVTLYSDARCVVTQQVVFLLVGTCGSPPTYADDGTQLFLVGPLNSAPVYQIGTSEICAPAVPLEGLELHTLGAAVQYDAFGIVTRDLL